jgi:hypothetical protein
MIDIETLAINCGVLPRYTNKKLLGDYVISRNEKLRQFAEAYLSTWLKEQEVLAYILRNEYNEYRLEPSDELNIRQFPIEVEVKLIALPSEVK